MLPRVLSLAMALYLCVSVSVCLTVTSRCFIKTGGRIELVLYGDMEASFNQSYNVL